MGVRVSVSVSVGSRESGVSGEDRSAENPMAGCGVMKEKAVGSASAAGLAAPVGLRACGQLRQWRAHRRGWRRERE